MKFNNSGNIEERASEPISIALKSLAARVTYRERWFSLFAWNPLHYKPWIVSAIIIDSHYLARHKKSGRKIWLHLKLYRQIELINDNDNKESVSSSKLIFETNDHFFKMGHDASVSICSFFLYTIYFSFLEYFYSRLMCYQIPYDLHEKIKFTISLYSANEELCTDVK